MAFHVRDPKTDALVREVARRRGIGAGLLCKGDDFAHTDLV